MDVQIIKEVIRIGILHMLSEKPFYSYHIVHLVTSVMPQVEEPMVYAVLRRLAEEGLVEQREDPPNEKPLRRCYQITSSGEKERISAEESWKELVHSAESMGIIC